MQLNYEIQDLSGSKQGHSRCWFFQVMFRKGKALSMKGDYDDAEDTLAAAAEMDSSIEADVKAALAANKQRGKAATAKQKQQFSNFFGKS